MNKYVLLLLLIFVVSCASPTGKVAISIEDHDADFNSLIVPFEKTQELREQLKNELKEYDSTGVGRKEVYEQYIDSLGVNGILAVLNEINPTCHDEAHDLGKIVFAKLKSIAPALQACNDGCYSGCMHGVMMETFSNADVSTESLKSILPEFCFDKNIASHNKPGDCAHGVGHALMFLSGYDIDNAVNSCSYFGNKAMEYYCATGTYMEYTNVYEAEDAQSKPEFYPCDTNKFPAACFRYKMNPAMKRLSEKFGAGAIEIMAKKCLELEGSNRLGCFHGFGNAHVTAIHYGVVSIGYVCSLGTEDDQKICIEGAIERIAKYEKESALKACETLSGWKKEVCLEGAEGDMYRLNKSFELYFS